MTEITLGSLFDGIGGFPYAASFYGIRPLWASEIIQEGISITKRHFPNMAHIGDITLLHGGRLPPVDIISFGSPCQGLSVSGKRQGLADERSGLFTEAIRIIDEMRDATYGQYPKFALWENVPGTFSSSGGYDYRFVLEAFTKSKIPIPPSGHWANAGMVRGCGVSLAWCVYNAQYFGTAQRRKRIFLVADFTGGCAGEILFVPKSLPKPFKQGTISEHGSAAFAEKSLGRTSWENKDALNQSTNPDIPIYCISGNIIGRKNHNGGNGNGYQKELAYTLTATDCHAVSAPVYGTNEQNPSQIGYHIRRLTPLECERLQGFPDNWTAFGHDGRPISDRKRYYMLGNSIAVPCAVYIMQGICQALLKSK